MKIETYIITLSFPNNLWACWPVFIKHDSYGLGKIEVSETEVWQVLRQLKVGYRWYREAHCSPYEEQPAECPHTCNPKPATARADICPPFSRLGMEVKTSRSSKWGWDQDGRFPSQKMSIPWPHGWKGLCASRTPNHPGLHANPSSGEEAMAIWNWSTESLNHLGWKMTAKIIESIQMRTICVLWIAVIWLCLCVLPRMAQAGKIFTIFINK